MAEVAAAHFHFSAQHVRPRRNRRALSDIVAYQRRTRERDLRHRSPVNSATAYMSRRYDLEAAAAEVGYHALISNGFEGPSAELWNAIDQAARRKDGQYKRHAGRLPRLGSFITASFPHGIALNEAADVVDRFLAAVSRTYRCALEAVIHLKGGRPDHAHILMSDRVVSASGVGKKIRCFNAVAEKAIGGGIVDGDKRLGSAMEMMRSTWAQEIRRASRDTAIDHRSFKRRGLPFAPVTQFRRGELEAEARAGTAVWKVQRANELAERYRFLASAPIEMSFDAPQKQDNRRARRARQSRASSARKLQALAPGHEPSLIGRTLPKGLVLAIAAAIDSSGDLSPGVPQSDITRPGDTAQANTSPKPHQLVLRRPSPSQDSRYPDITALDGNRLLDSASAAALITTDSGIGFAAKNAAVSASVLDQAETIPETDVVKKRAKKRWLARMRGRVRRGTLAVLANEAALRVGDETVLDIAAVRVEGEPDAQPAPANSVSTASEYKVFYEGPEPGLLDHKAARDARPLRLKTPTRSDTNPAPIEEKSKPDVAHVPSLKKSEVTAASIDKAESVTLDRAAELDSEARADTKPRYTGLSDQHDRETVRVETTHGAARPSPATPPSPLAATKLDLPGFSSTNGIRRAYKLAAEPEPLSGSVDGRITRPQSRNDTEVSSRSSGDSVPRPSGVADVSPISSRDGAVAKLDLPHVKIPAPRRPGTPQNEKTIGNDDIDAAPKLQHGAQHEVVSDTSEAPPRRERLRIPPLPVFGNAARGLPLPKVESVVSAAKQSADADRVERGVADSFRGPTADRTRIAFPSPTAAAAARAVFTILSEGSQPASPGDAKKLVARRSPRPAALVDPNRTGQSPAKAVRNPEAGASSERPSEQDGDAHLGHPDFGGPIAPRSEEGAKPKGASAASKPADAPSLLKPEGRLGADNVNDQKASNPSAGTTAAALAVTYAACLHHDHALWRRFLEKLGAATGVTAAELEGLMNERERVLFPVSKGDQSPSGEPSGNTSPALKAAVRREAQECGFTALLTAIAAIEADLTARRRTKKPPARKTPADDNFDL